MYNVTPFTNLHPAHNRAPAAYDPAPKKLLDRPSTMSDVADFVVDYISSDVSFVVVEFPSLFSLVNFNRFWAWWQPTGC